jgi:hypothetical protein
VLHWSGAAAGNLSVAEVARKMGRQLTDADRSRIDTAVRCAAYAVIQGKERPGSGRRRSCPHGAGH